jgi:hypothetical protein
MGIGENYERKITPILSNISRASRGTDTFAGIRPADVPWFLIAQFLGGIAATLVFRWLAPNLQVRANQVLLTHHPELNR